MPINPEVKPVDGLRRAYGDDYYIWRFQEPGEIEAEFAQTGAKEVVKNFLAYRTPGPLTLPKGKGFGYSADRPSWITEEELDYYASKFEKTGFELGIECTLVESQGKCASEVYCGRVRPHVLYARGKRICAQWRVQNRCAIIAGSSGDGRCRSLCC
ncbi:epoxide hydrolase 1-like [Henckelia pumila]|uniref:epoxide hydrolase 1-like n=1 Tax=Henckelia pumila TaxID=405737 RepID=UPI003C6E4862